MMIEVEGVLYEIEGSRETMQSIQECVGGIGNREWKPGVNTNNEGEPEVLTWMDGFKLMHAKIVSAEVLPKSLGGPSRFH